MGSERGAMDQEPPRQAPDMTGLRLPPGVRSSPGLLARHKRLQDAIALRRPDRVPVAPMWMYYPNACRGIANREMHYNRPLHVKLLRDAIVEHDWDAAFPAWHLPNARLLELTGATQLQWPGGTLADNAPFQYVEGAYMRQDEYDEMLSDPNGFVIRKMWPRVCTTLRPLSAIARHLPPLIRSAESRTMPALLGNWLSDRQTVEMLERLLALSKEAVAEEEAVAGFVNEMLQLGYPFLFEAMSSSGFDCVGNLLRGLRGTMLDMYQVPDKLLAAVDMFVPLTIEPTVAWARATTTDGVFLPLHRGSAGFMSDEQFRRFYWPGLKALLLGLIDAGLTPMPFFEGDYTPRLKYLSELPPGKILGRFDRVDRRKAKELIGDTMCFWGNVPSSLMCAGTPEQVKDDVRELIDIFGDNGGLIIDCSIGIPDEAKPENVFALTEAAREYGVHK